jgi:hypothetical protein
VGLGNVFGTYDILQDVVSGEHGDREGRAASSRKNKINIGEAIDLLERRKLVLSQDILGLECVRPQPWGSICRRRDQFHCKHQPYCTWSTILQESF